MMDNSDKIILDLCGGTGSWSRPYKEAGYDVEPKLNLYIRPNRTKPSISFQHKSMWKNVPQLSFHEPQTDAEFRAMTPPGFAQAFFKANQ